MAPRSVLTPKVHKKLVEAVAAGSYRVAAAIYAGVPRSTLYYWTTRGEKALAAAEEEGQVEWGENDEGIAIILSWEADPKELPYVQLHLDLVRADAISEVRHVTHWAAASRTDWRAAKEFLARRHPERWGDRGPTSEDGAPLAIESGQPALPAAGPAAILDDDERLAEVIAVLEEAGALPAGATEALTEEIPDAEVVDDGVLPDEADPQG